MGTHERLGEGYASREEPCAVRLLRNDHDVLGIIADFLRDKPRRALAPPPCEVQELRALVRRIDRERLQWRELAEKRRVKLRTATASARRATRCAEEALAVAEEQRQRCERRIAEEAACVEELQQEAAARKRLVERELDAKLKDQRLAHAKQTRELKLECSALLTAAEQRLAAEQARRVQQAQEVDEAAKERLARLAAAREAAAREAAEFERQFQEQQAAATRLRSARKQSALEQMEALEAENRRLKERRKATQLKVSDANLARQATKVAQEQLSKERATLRGFWGEALDLAARSKELEGENAQLVDKLVGMQRDLEAQ
eukprot:632920-Prymnesium_polylepis.1